MNGEPGGRQAGEIEKTLTSWKEIAGLLGVSVRTAHSYEKSQALPVRRSGSRALALEHELRAWQAARQAPAPWWNRPRVLQWRAGGATAAFLACALAGFWYYWSHLVTGPPVTAS